MMREKIITCPHDRRLKAAIDAFKSSAEALAEAHTAKAVATGGSQSEYDYEADKILQALHKVQEEIKEKLKKIKRK